jgi:hypothetical protein
MLRLARGHSTVPEGTVVEEVSSLEVRWILPGQLDLAVAGWFGRSGPESEAREDAYLIDPDLGGLSVKVRGGRALEVKQFQGSPGVRDCPGRARGRLQYWQKWSFPFDPSGQDTGDTGGWRRIRKQRRISRFALVDEVRCAVELTEIRMHYQEWWSLGFEATGPAGLLRSGLEATAALVFAQYLPADVELRIDDSTSYADWLRVLIRRG